MLRTMLEENPNDWDKLLQKPLMHNRSAEPSSTKMYALQMFG